MSANARIAGITTHLIVIYLARNCLALPFGRIGIHAESISSGSNYCSPTYIRGGDLSPRSPPGRTLMRLAEPGSNDDFQPREHLSTTYQELSSLSKTDVSKNTVKNQLPSPVMEEWRDGERKCNLLSRLLYHYVSPLLAVSKKRQLEASDVFFLDDNRKMKNSVTKLEEIYDECNHEKVINSSESSGNGHNVINSEIIKNEQVAHSSFNLAKALVLHQKKRLLTTGILRLLNTIIQAFPALLVSRLLRIIEEGEVHSPYKALNTALALTGVLTLKMVVENQYFHGIVKCATHARGSLSGMIFDKSLRISSNSALNSDEVKKTDDKNQTVSIGVGGAINLMQTTSLIESATLQIHTLWDGLLQITIFTALLFKYLGPSVLYGLSVLLLSIPKDVLTLRVLTRLSKYENEARQARSKRTTEALMNMKLLKLQGWEKKFKEGIEKSRKEELRRQKNRGIFRALNQAISNSIPAIVLVVTLEAYRRTGKPIVASTIFTAVSLLNQLRLPLYFYPMVIDSLANGKIVLQKISSYLNQEESTPYVQRLQKEKDGGGSIELENGNFVWSSAKVRDGSNEHLSVVPALCGANLFIKAGEVVAVVGGVGSGKTALVKALLGELTPVSRNMVDQSLDRSIPSHNVSYTTDISIVRSKGSIAYCAQESWLAKGTIREAIIFGREYDASRYRDAIFDAGLDLDIRQGTLSHDTDVGEGGSSLSGGQRARVQLARALYDDDAGVYLLDDPLSALDTSVGSLVFDRITRRLKQRKVATILVTNDPKIPRQCDRVILVGKSTQQREPCCEIIDVGLYDDLVKRGHDLTSLSKNEIKALTDGSNSQFETDVKKDLNKNHESDFIAKNGFHVEQDTIEKTHIVDYNQDLIKTNGEDDSQIEKSIEYRSAVPELNELNVTVSKKLTSVDDTMTNGAVPFSVYTNYLKSVKKPIWVIAVLLSFFVASGAQIFQQYTVAQWANVGSGDAAAIAQGGKYIRSLIYAAGAVSSFIFLRSFFLLRVGIRASTALHNRLLSSVFNAPLSFFDATPSGQLLSRFGKEIEVVDQEVPNGFGSVLFCFLQIFMSVAALTGVVTPAMLIPVLVTGVFYTSTMARFRPAARDLKRCESKSRAPIFTHFGEALRGVETIRSFNRTSMWSSKHRNLTDTNLSVYFTVKNLDRWLSIRLESLGNVFVLAASIASIVLTRSGRLKPGSAGWGLTQALSITGLLAWAVRCLTDLETQMMSVMRVTEMTENLSQVKKANGTFSDTPKLTISEHSNPGDAFSALLRNNETTVLPFTPQSNDALIKAGWPWMGGVEFKNISVRYNPLSSRVIKNVTVSLPPGSTLGVVGRTGSGKSSLLLSLFRIMEIETGSITIDGIDTRSLSLQSLRDSLSIIPQDPVLFAGTVKYNIDATGKSTEKEIWSALNNASPDLAHKFKSSGLGLESPISEGGKNLSVGQRQLICLTRALLKSSKVLVMDEATSSVDSKTDKKVQTTIWREFVNKGVSVITVAHRLETVLGYDNVLVLGDGEVLEYGSPAELLKLPNGHFRKLVQSDEKNKVKGLKQIADDTPLAISKVL